MIESQFLTVRETAVALRLNIFSVYRLIEGRRLAHIRIGRKILVDRASLERWIAARTVGERRSTGLALHGDRP
jgi:excisionase family DNA binding protein